MKGDPKNVARFKKKYLFDFVSARNLKYIIFLCFLHLIVSSCVLCPVFERNREPLLYFLSCA